jgi:hypothetical protein
MNAPICFSPPYDEKTPQQPVRASAHSHSHLSIGRKVADESYALPYPFPDGAVWAAIRHGVVMNMVYMNSHDVSVSFGLFRQRSRAALAKEGEVWTGAVRGGCFVPSFDSTDVRSGGALNTARVVDQ